MYNYTYDEYILNDNNYTYDEYILNDKFIYVNERLQEYKKELNQRL